MDRLLELINRKFLKDSEFLELEDNDNVISCEYYRPHNAHYKEFLVTINNNGKIEEHIVCYKATIIKKYCLDIIIYTVLFISLYIYFLKISFTFSLLL